MATRKREPGRTRAGWVNYYWQRYCKLGRSDSLHMCLFYELLIARDGA